jgi:competence protein CoiA
MPPDQVEVLIEKDGERHCADILRTDGTVVELRASYISPEEIRERERFFKPRRMVWLFDVREAAEDGPTGPRLDLRPKDDIHTFRWKQPKKHVAFASAPSILDLGDAGVFHLKRLHLEGGPPYGGWGKLFDSSDFAEWLRSTDSA